MNYKVKKIIEQYTLVDLLEILQYANHPEYNEAQAELAKRNPSEKELTIAKRGLGYRNKARNRPLSFIDILYCLFAPLTEQKSRFTAARDIEDSFDNAIAEFEYYNESRRARQMKKCKQFVIGFWGILGAAGLLIVILYFIKDFLW